MAVPPARLNTALARSSAALASRFVALALSLVAATATPVAWPGAAATAQVVRGRLMESGEGGAIASAMMTLRDRDGRDLDQALSRTASGLFELQAPGPGEYRVQAERIGYATTHSEYFRLAVGDTLVIRMTAPVEPVVLAGIEAEAGRRCRVRPSEGLAVARVWNEARKALATAAWTQRRGVYQYDMLSVRRDLDDRARKVLVEHRARAVLDAPFAARPTDSLAAHGFARITAEEALFWAPDADVFLSDPFLDTHCFKVKGGEPGQVGLAFEPVPDRKAPEIAGTMWLDAATAALRRLEFDYENLNVPRSLRAARPGGRVSFRALPDGTWIVDSWNIRMFRAGAEEHPRTGDLVAVLDGVSEQGGDVLRVLGPDSVVFEADPGVRVAGIVRDSVGAPLPGARVFWEGTGTEAYSGADGRFEIAHLRPGRYSFGFAHPYMDSYSHYPLDRLEVEIERDRAKPAEIEFAAPSVATILEDICGRSKPPRVPVVFGSRMYWADGLLMGRVTDPDGDPVGSATVRVRVPSADVGAEFNARDQAIRTTKTNDDGFYSACWVAVGALLEVAVYPPGADPDDGPPPPPAALRTITLDRESPHQTLDFSAVADPVATMDPPPARAGRVLRASEPRHLGS